MDTIRNFAMVAMHAVAVSDGIRPGRAACRRTPDKCQGQPNNSHSAPNQHFLAHPHSLGTTQNNEHVGPAESPATPRGHHAPRVPAK